MKVIGGGVSSGEGQQGSDDLRAGLEGAPVVARPVNSIAKAMAARLARAGGRTARSTDRA